MIKPSVLKCPGTLFCILLLLFPVAGCHTFQRCQYRVESLEMVWVSVEDAEFSGQVSRYPTTNADYAHYLNRALADGLLVVDGNYVKGADGVTPKLGYASKKYYKLEGAGHTFDGAVNGGAARIDYNGNIFTVQDGFEKHPVTFVSWYGASVFCKYYGWRLPTSTEWQRVARYDGSYRYGCGPRITHQTANYKGSIHPHGTTPVGAFGLYGYGLADMAGNVWEWTATESESGNLRLFHGGSWHYDATYSAIDYIGRQPPDCMIPFIGFRVFR